VARDALQPSGTISPGDLYEADRYVLKVAQHPPLARSDQRSPWGGMSGAPLFCGNLLMGVIATDSAGFGHSALTAVPAYVLHHDDAFRRALGHPVTLEPAEWQGLTEPPLPDVARSPSNLLLASRAVVPFHGRNEVLTQLHAWADEPGFGTWLLNGQGGQGKTRLAHHFGDQLASRGWAVLWLRPTADGERDMAVLGRAAVPTLVVVDYAETRPAQLAALLRSVATSSLSTRIKLLLLARTAGSWWETLTSTDHLVEAMAEGAVVAELPALEAISDIDRAYWEAVKAFAVCLKPDHNWTELTKRLSPPRSRSPHLQVALTLHMTALADLLDAARLSPSSVRDSDVEVRLLNHESRYWRASAKAVGVHPTLTMECLTDALAAATLLGASDHVRADVLLADVPRLADASNDQRAGVREWIATLYPPATATAPWSSLQPDRLAEHFIGLQLGKRGPDLINHLIGRATEDQLVQLLTLCARAANHKSYESLRHTLSDLCAERADLLAGAAIEVAPQVEHPDPLLHGLRRIIDDPATDVDVLLWMVGQLPESSLVLADVAAHLNDRLVRETRSRDMKSELATSLENLASRQAEQGECERAFVTISEAVTIRRELADDNAGLVALATCLANLSAREADLGNYMRALDTITTAVNISRSADIRGSGESLAVTLNNLAVRLSDLGFDEEALTAATEAVEICRRLATDNPFSLPRLATSLDHLAVALAKLDRSEDAWRASTEAVDIRRRLSESYPDTYLPDLAESLHNIAVLHADLGLYDEAMAAITEAAGIRRQLALTRPGVYLPALATSLQELASQLNDVGRGREAMNAINESVRIWRQLRRDRPAAHRYDLTVAIGLQAWLLDRHAPDEG
jgi:tetratricopeptide (TPR) repeat protein